VFQPRSESPFGPKDAAKPESKDGTKSKELPNSPGNNGAKGAAPLTLTPDKALPGK